VLTPAHLRTIRALGDTLIPSLADGDPTGGDVLPDALDDFVRHLEPTKRRQLGMVLTIFDLTAVPRYGRRFANLSPERRSRYVEGWMTSRLAMRRVIFRSLRMMCSMLYFQDPRSWPLVKYDGPMVKR
jgi:hypothetical protein